jgi:hypothetical protein
MQMAEKTDSNGTGIMKMVEQLMTDFLILCGCIFGQFNGVGS